MAESARGVELDAGSQTGCRAEKPGRGTRVRPHSTLSFRRATPNNRGGARRNLLLP